MWLEQTEEINDQMAPIPWEIKVKIASFCSYSAVLSLGRSSLAFHNLLHEPTLIREIAETVYYSRQFNNTGLWSSTHLDIQHAKSICIAVEMTTSSAKKSISLAEFIAPKIILASYSHPLTCVFDLKTLQQCLCIAEYYKLANSIPDIAFCLVATTLEQGKLEQDFYMLRSITRSAISNSEGLPIIIFLAINLSREDFLVNLPRPRLSLIPFGILLGEFLSLLTGRYSIATLQQTSQLSAVTRFS